jgi:hypothetical protein
VPEVREAADLWLVGPSVGQVVVELKYLVRAANVTVDGERFVLVDQSAHDIRRYDVLKDLARVERWATAGLAQRGLVIALTNDPSYWKPSSRDANDAAFRLHDGRQLTGELAWAATAGAGSTAGRTTPIVITGQYRSTWHNYALLPNGHQVRALVLDTAIGLSPGNQPETGEASA